MSDFPVLFSVPMVAALLAERKTETRRLTKPAWKAGDRLYVREHWRIAKGNDHLKPSEIVARRCTTIYEAGGSSAGVSQFPKIGGRHAKDYHHFPKESAAGEKWVGRLRQGMFMMRWQSRLTLRVKEVRQERLQDISEADAIAEGITGENVIVGATCAGGRHSEISEHRWFFEGCREDGFDLAVEAFDALWNAINPKSLANSNPKVWVTRFEALPMNIDAQDKWP